MTVSTTASRLQYTGNAVTTVFAGPKADASSDIKVYLDEALQGSGYAVTGVGDAATSITFTSAPGSGVVVTVARVVPLTQGRDYVSNDPFPAESHEAALDKLTYIEQQQQDEIDRSLRFPITDLVSVSGELPSAASRANKVLAFDANGAPTVDDVDANAAAASATAAAASAAAAATSAAALPQNDFTKTTDPTAGDDSDDGWSVGSRWANITLDKMWQCLDASVGAAVWLDVSVDASDLGAAALKGVDTNLSGASTADDVPTALAAVTYTDAHGLVQRVIDTDVAVSQILTPGQVPEDDTLPQRSEGTEILSRTITPNNAANMLKFTVTVTVSPAAGERCIISLFEVDSNDAVKSWTTGTLNNGEPKTFTFIHERAAGETSEQTWSVRIGPVTANTALTINGSGASRVLGGALETSLLIEERKA